VSELKILLDECTPLVVKHRLPHLDISTVQVKGWEGKTNGDLLALAETEFDVFVTTDKNLTHQQNLSGRSLAVILLPSNQVPVVLDCLVALEKILNSISPGAYVEIQRPAPL